MRDLLLKKPGPKKKFHEGDEEEKDTFRGNEEAEDGLETDEELSEEEVEKDGEDLGFDDDENY